MRVLIVVPSVADTSPATPCQPRRDYHALQGALLAAGHSAELLDFGAAGVRSDLKLALKAFWKRKKFDAIYVNAESLGVPLALLCRWLDGPRRPRIVCVGHRLLTGRKRLFFRVLKAHLGIDRLLVYASTQEAFAVGPLGIEQSRVRRIHFHADACFFSPQFEIAPDPKAVCAVGREGRDYPTLFEALEKLPDTTLTLTTASPWSRRADSSRERAIPKNVSCAEKPLSDIELRDLYASSGIVAVPLDATDFQAGITSILEAFALGRPVIATATVGLADVLWDGHNCLTVAPGDVAGWRTAIRVLQERPELAKTLGRNAHRWVRERATLEHWTQSVVAALVETSR